MPYLLNDDGEIERCAATHRNTLVRRDYGPDLPLTRTVPPRERRRRARAGTRGRRGARPVDRWTGFSARPLDEVVKSRVWVRHEFGWCDDHGHHLRDALYVPNGTSGDELRAALEKLELILLGYASPGSTSHVHAPQTH